MRCASGDRRAAPVEQRNVGGARPPCRVHGGRQWRIGRRQRQRGGMQCVAQRQLVEQQTVRRRVVGQMGQSVSSRSMEMARMREVSREGFGTGRT